MRFFLCILLLFLCSSLFVMSSNLYAAGFTGMSFAEEQTLTDLHSQRKTGNFIRNSGLNKLNMAFKQTAPINSKLPATLIRPVNYSAASLRNLVKLKALTPQGLALTAALTAAGYLFDDDGEVVTSSPDETYQEGYFWSHGFIGSHSSPAAAGAATAAYKNANLLEVITLSPTQIQVRTYTTNPSQWGGEIFNRGTCSSIVDPYCPAVAPVTTGSPITDEDFIDNVAPELEWDSVPFDDAGQPFQTPEYTETINNLNNWYETNYNDNSQTSTSTSTSTTIINNDGSETTTETAEQDIPAFCTWAGIVCDAINWMREPFESPTDVLLPTEEVEIPPYTSGLPDSGSCPAPYDVTAFGTAIAISYQPFCDLASIIRPLVLAASGLFAAYILVGRGAKS